MKRNQFFENRHPGIKIAFKIGVSDANRAKCKQTNECKQKITSCVKKLQFIISKNLDATLSVTGTLAPFLQNFSIGVNPCLIWSQCGFEFVYFFFLSL